MSLFHAAVMTATLHAHASASDSAPAPAAAHDWLGPEWYANRLQDWHREGDTIVCDDSRLPVRTAHWLISRVEPKDGLSPTCSATISLSVAPLGSGASVGADDFAGLLLGAGNESIDYRLTALVQSVPAPDGGLLAVVDGAGVPLLLDFSTPRTESFSWTLPNTTTRQSLQPLNGAVTTTHRAADRAAPVQLTVTIAPESAGTYSLMARSSQGDTPLGEAVAHRISRAAIDGAFALVSHRAQRAPAIGWTFSDLQSRAVADGSGESCTRSDWFVDRCERAWGPILAATYTLDRRDDGTHDLAMVAHLPPGAGIETVSLDLAPPLGEPVGSGQEWTRIAEASIDSPSATAQFRVTDIDRFLGGRYRLSCPINGTTAEYVGTIRAPDGDGETTIAALSCVKHIVALSEWNRNGVWFPHDELTAHVAAHDPDMLFFAGDQLYEGDITPVDPRETLLDYHSKFQRWLWAFGELCRDRPTVLIPDDHDVFHGNLWGSGGVSATERARARASDGLSAQDAGGYKLSGDVVNAIHRTQVGNLPPRAAEVDATIGQDIEPYSTRLRYGTADCLVLADRMWKSSASVTVPEGKCVNGFFKADGFDPRTADRADAQLLGAEQEALLDRWAGEHDARSPRKVLLSQSPFFGLHTLPEGKDDGVVPSLPVYAEGGYAPDDVPSADTDTNGWPQGARTRAVRELQRAQALHLAGDQHLGSLARYGVDAFGDGPMAFTPPAIANTWPRRWMPRDPAENAAALAPDAPRGTGDYFDAFGNRVTVLAVTNPEARGLKPERLYDLSPGYGIITIQGDGSYDLAAWPRWVDPKADGATPFPGWPYHEPAPTKAGTHE